MRRLIASVFGVYGIVLSCIFFEDATKAATLINGAGATFPFPLYSKWFSEFHKVDSTVQINYQSIGSGGGIRQLLQKTVDFGASDIPMTDQQISKASSPILHLPMVIGAVVVTYHLEGIPKGLNLDGKTLADIYLGNVTQWDDPRILRLNSKLKLPHEPIFVVRRSDGSGTSALFTDYLSKVSSEWKQKVGTGTAVRWPVGLGGKGNEGVAGLVQQTPGSIGYVEHIYAETNHLPYAAIENKAGKFILPDLSSLSSAAEKAGKDSSEDFRVSITNSEGLQSYPLSALTYLLVYPQMSKEKGQPLVRFLNWALKEGQEYASSLHYAPLPIALRNRILLKIKTIQLQ